VSTHATYALGQTSKGDAVRPAQASRREQAHVEHGKIAPAEFAQILGNEVAVSKRKIGDNYESSQGSPSRTTPQDLPRSAAKTSPEATPHVMPQESPPPKTPQTTLLAIPRQQTPQPAPPASLQGARRATPPQESPRAAPQATPQTPRQTASKILQAPSSIPSATHAVQTSARESVHAPTTPFPDTRSAEPWVPSAQEPAATYSAQVNATQENPRSGRNTAARQPGGGTLPGSQVRMEEATSEPRGQHAAEALHGDKEKIAVEPSFSATRPSVTQVSRASLESTDHAEIPSGRNPAPSAGTVSAIPQQASLSHNDPEPQRADDRAPILQSAVATHETSAQHQQASQPSNAARATHPFAPETASSAQAPTGPVSAYAGNQAQKAQVSPSDGVRRGPTRTATEPAGLAGIEVASARDPSWAPPPARQEARTRTSFNAHERTGEASSASGRRGEPTGATRYPASKARRLWLPPRPSTTTCPRLRTTPLHHPTACPPSRILRPHAGPKLPV
jgi:hypothetical protein